MLSNLPCLMDLKAKSLRERHWKMISDVVGSDIKVHKVTLGFLDQNNVFNFSNSVVRIVRTAEMEEQLDVLVDNLRRSWTERRLVMTPRHGVPMVADFPGLYATVTESMRTLKQLGSSQYSTGMGDQLVGWYKTVREAKAAIDVIKTTQKLWLAQDAPFTSMPFEEENPSAFAFFRAIRSRLARDFNRLSQAASLVGALSDKDLISSIDDSRLALEDVAAELPNALLAVRVASPRLFFLADEELLEMLDVSYQNICQMERYLARIFPCIRRLLLVEGTELQVTRRGYNPEILGVESKDGETVKFVEPMKARLEVDYWVKCVGLSLRQTLRAHSRSIWKVLGRPGGFLSNLEGLWHSEEPAAVQMVVATVHAAWSAFALEKLSAAAAAAQEGGEAAGPAAVACRVLFLRLRQSSLALLTQAGDSSEARRARERVKVFLLEYYLHKFGRDGALGDVALYAHDERTGILRVRAFHRTFNYGYEYHAQHVCFSPALSTERPLHMLLRNVVQGYTSRVCHGPRSPLLRQLGLLFGRYIACFLAGCGQALENVLLGAITSGSWVVIDGVGHSSAGDVRLLRSLTEKLRVLQQRHVVTVSGRDIPIRHGVKHELFLSWWAEREAGRLAFDPSRYRQVALNLPSRSLLLKSALTAKGNISDTVVAELAFVVNEISRSSASSATANDMDVLQKMLAAIQLSAARAATKEVYRNFLALGARSFLKGRPQLRQNVAWPGEFRAEMDRMLSIDEQLMSGEESELAGSELLLENFKQLRACVNFFPVTTICDSDYGNVLLRKCVALLKAHAAERGGEVLSLCAESQLPSEAIVLRLKRALFSLSPENEFLLIVEGRSSAAAVNLIAHLSSEYGTRNVKVLVTGCAAAGGGDAALPPNRLSMQSDESAAIAALLCPHWGRQRCRPTKSFTDLLAAVSAASRILCSLGEPMHAEAIATTVGLRTKDCEQADPLESLVSAVASNLLPSKKKAFLAQAKGDPSIRALSSSSQVWDEDSGEHKATKASEAELKPQLSIDHGNTDLFVPTQETARVVDVLSFLLLNKTSVILYGKEGAGKTTAIGKMLELLPKQSRVIFLRLGTSPTYEQEDALLRGSDLNGETVVVLEGFRFDTSHHAAFTESLVRGRFLFDEQREQFVQLSPLTLCVEAVYPEAEGGVGCRDEFEEGLRRTRADLVPVHMRKPFDDDAHILASAMSIFAKDFSEEVQAHIPELKSFIIGWHKFMKNKFPAITDHVLYRLVSGLLLANPEEVTSVRHLNCHLYNELDAEYSCFSRGEAIDSLLDEFSPYLRGKLFEDSDNMLLSIFQSTARGCAIEMKEKSAVQAALVEAYDSVKGSAYNNCLTFSAQLVKTVVKLIRAYERFQSTVIVGPSGSGKHAAAKLFAHYMNLTLQECPGNFEAFKAALLSGYLSAIRGEQLLIYISLKDRAEALDAFELLDSMLYYGDLPHLISEAERSAQLFIDDKVVEFRALCDEQRYKDAQDEKIFKVQDNLHVVIDVTAELFDAAQSRTPQLLTKSGLIDCHHWPKQVLEAMARERLGVMLSTAKTEFPLGAVCKAFAALHTLMATHSGVLSTQYLDVISLFPDLYARLRKKLMETENSLKAGIQCVERSNGFIKQLADDISVKEPELAKLATEIEQLNKRLTQERINLDKASKAFRRKEVAARKKSEETQDLAEDAHKNLEAALPSLDAAMQALTSIDKVEFLELRQLKSPPEVIQQVMEAVCILLGVKTDWATAKQILLDPYFQQKMIDIEKENIPEQSVKKIRRYTDNARFVPDEIAKVSKAAAAMCMWVRAVDLYMKIFKSIEPKRMKLMQAESELAELMTALREETDRVAHTETTIASIQSTMADRAKRKTTVEALVRRVF